MPNQARRILVVDDEPVNRELLEDMLVLCECSGAGEILP